MPGPMVHTAAMQQCSKLLAKSGVNVKPGWWIANMLADKDLSSHGYSFETGTGTILEQIKAISAILKPLRSISPVYFEHACRLICHLCVDSFSIGQLSRDRWGKIDNRIDFMSEFVWSKKKYKVGTNFFVDRNEYHLEYMKTCYKWFMPNSNKIRFLMSNEHRSMVRYSVKWGAEFAYNWIMRGIE
jgi:hypothetical protein